MDSTFITSLITVINDYAKLEAMRLINTGDRAIDNSLIMIVLLIMNAAVAFLFKNKISRLYLYVKIYFITTLNYINASYINEYYNDDGERSACIYINIKTADLHKIVLLYNNIYCISGGFYTLENNIITQDDRQATISHIEIANLSEKLKKAHESYTLAMCESSDSKTRHIRFFVIFMYNHNFVFIKHDTLLFNANEHRIGLSATSNQIIGPFQDYLRKCDIKHVEAITKCLKIYVSNEFNISADLLPNRNMSMYVSNYKKKIVSLLDKFMSNEPVLGGYGSKNLGVMLYGEPGTGKTLLMKVIANYLQRDIRIIDMRKIKTRQQFIELFTLRDNVGLNIYKKCVYVLDEFDCIKGVVANRANLDPNADVKQTNVIKELKDRRLQILQIPISDGNNENLKAELVKINTELSDFENALTLDTMLTVLDGVIEHEGRVIIAATNYIDNIDPALIRDGRFDIKLKLEKFTTEETRELLGIMFKDEREDMLFRLKSAKLIGDKYTPAHLVNLAREHDSLSDLLDILEMRDEIRDTAGRSGRRSNERSNGRSNGRNTERSKECNTEKKKKRN